MTDPNLLNDVPPLPLFLLLFGKEEGFTLCGLRELVGSVNSEVVRFEVTLYHPGKCRRTEGTGDTPVAAVKDAIANFDLALKYAR